MHKTQAFVILASVASAFAAGAGAPPAVNNPKGVSFTAEFAGNIKGSVVIASSDDGKGVGVNVDLDFQKAPKDSKPYSYHIHVSPVPENQPTNCNATGGHLNPFKAGTDCKTSDQASCEVGDLSGKHGKADTALFKAKYTDLYVSTDSRNPAYPGGGSLVIHSKDGSRLACANFKRSGGSGTGLPGGDHAAPPSKTYPNGTVVPTGAPPEGVAPRVGASVSGVFMLVAALVWMW